MMTDNLTIPEVAAIARAPEATVRWWVHTGQLRGFKLGRRRLFTRAEVEAFIAAAQAGA